MARDQRSRKVGSSTEIATTVENIVTWREIAPRRRERKKEPMSQTMNKIWSLFNLGH